MRTERYRAPVPNVFSPEPDHGWCYYFEKAELARQVEDWEKVVELGDEARRVGFAPADGTEWLPFIEGYASAGRYDEASALVRVAREGVLTRTRQGYFAPSTPSVPK